MCQRRWRTSRRQRDLELAAGLAAHPESDPYLGVDDVRAQAEKCLPLSNTARYSRTWLLFHSSMQPSVSGSALPADPRPSIAARARPAHGTSQRYRSLRHECKGQQVTLPGGRGQEGGQPVPGQSGQRPQLVEQAPAVTQGSCVIAQPGDALAARCLDREWPTDRMQVSQPPRSGAGRCRLATPPGWPAE